MKGVLKNKLSVMLSLLMLASLSVEAQVCEWKLDSVVYNSADPDGAGPAKGSVSFRLRIRTTSGSIANINAITAGWNWQSANAMIPTTPGCAIVSNPANVTVSPDFQAAGFSYTTVNQCGSFSQTLGGQSFDKRAVGTLDGTGITLTTTWVDVFTVTLWSLNATAPYAGYATINSGNGGSPAPFSTYSASDDLANEYVINSLSTTPALGLNPNTILPVNIKDYFVQCSDKGALLSWSTASEHNTKVFNILKSVNGTDWVTVDRVNAAGNSDNVRTYQYMDASGGNVFYRVQEVDIDGKETYTDIKHTSCSVSQMNVILYPVPARDNITLVVQTAKATNAQLQIIDVNGKVVKQIQTTFNAGNNNLRIDLSTLPAGQYMLINNSLENPIQKKFVIQR